MGRSGRPFIVAHRGASYDAPENTMAAFTLGFEQGADAIELDIHLTRDRQIVAIHDADTKRVAGVAVKIAEQTLEQLRGINVAAHGKWLEQGRREGIPTLEEVLAIIPTGRKALVEVKCGCEVLPELEAVFGRSGLTPEQTAIITFHEAVARACKQRFPDRYVQRLFGCDRKQNGECETADQLIARAGGVDGLGLDQNFPIDAAFVARVKAAGLGCYVWTVDNPARARELVQAGVDGITTNRPGLLRKEL